MLTCERCNQAPADKKSRKIVTGLEVLEDKITGNIHANVWDVKHRKDDIELGTLQLQVFYEAIDLSVADIRSADNKPSARCSQHSIACFRGITCR